MRPTGEKHVTDVHRLNAKLYHALLKEDADQVKVKELCAEVDEQGLHILTIHDDTVLQVVIYSKQTDLVLSLLQALPDHHLDKMTRQNHKGNTVLHDAATSSHQSIEVAETMLKKAPGLLCMRNHPGETALFQAVRYGRQKMFDFLVKRIDSYSDANKQLFLQRSDKTTILHMAILGRHFDLAFKIAKSFEHLVYERDADGMTGLQLLSCQPGAFRCEAPKKEFLEQILSFGLAAEKRETENKSEVLKLAQFLIERDTSWEATYPGIDHSKPRLHKYGCTTLKVEPLMSSLGQGEGETGTPLFLATKSGCVEVAKEILDTYPQAVEHIDDKGRNVLHVAIKHRQLEIFDLIAIRAEKKKLFREIDNEGNSILHTVGLKMHDYEPEKMLGPALELQQELLWFERVKKVLPSHLIDHRNNKKQTAEGFFATTQSTPGNIRRMAKADLRRMLHCGSSDRHRCLCCGVHSTRRP